MESDRLTLRTLCRRASASLLGALQIGLLLGHASDASRQVVVVFVSGVEAYSEAVEGIRTGLSKRSQTASFVDLKTATGESDLAQLLQRGSPLVVTVGTEALNAVEAQKRDAPVLSTMILRADRPPPRAGSVLLDVPLAGMLGELKSMFPGKTRLGMIWNPAHDGPIDGQQQSRAKQQGFTLHVLECSRAQDLLKVFLAMKGKVDFVIVLPDSSLYNNTTVRPLILASLENRLPIVAFSPSFVRAGAAAGIYPDFQDIGWQTAEAAQRYLAGQPMLDETPRKLRVAVNQRVMRLLGLDHKPPHSGEPVIYR